MSETVHNFQPVSIAVSGPLVFTCCQCGRRVTQGRETVWADLNGEPFRAYYCQDCMEKAKSAIDNASKQW